MLHGTQRRDDGDDEQAVAPAVEPIEGDPSEDRAPDAAGPIARATSVADGRSTVASTAGPDDSGAGSRPIGAAVLSLVWPGLGHVATGQRRIGVAIASLTAVAVASTAVWLSARSPVAPGAWATVPSQLRAIIWVAVAALVLRLAVLLDAVRPLGHRTGERGWMQGLGVTAVLLLVAVPHAAVVVYADAQLDTLTTVFADAPAPVARPSPLPTVATGSPIAPPDETTAPISATASPTLATPTTTDSVVPSLPVPPTTDVPAPSSAVSPDPASPTVATPPTAAGPLTTWQGEERLNVAVLGSDGAYDRAGIRTDVMIVVSIEVATGDATVFSVPRNWKRLPFPAGTSAAAAYPRGYDDFANAIYGLGSRQPSLFPGTEDPGGTAVKLALAQLLGIPVHYYVLVDMHAVVDVVDLFGGIDLYVDEHISDRIKPIDPGGRSLTIDVDPGWHHLDGPTTLAYVRSRRQSSDYRRMTRQRCVVGAMVDQVAMADVMLRYRSLTELIRSHVTTDIPIDDLPDLLPLADRLDTQRIRTVTFIPPRFPDGPAPVGRVREEVQRSLTAEPPGDVTDLAAACGP